MLKINELIPGNLYKCFENYKNSITEATYQIYLNNFEGYVLNLNSIIMFIEYVVYFYKNYKHELAKCLYNEKIIYIYLNSSTRFKEVK